jgi:hypothetical protein
MRTIVCARQPCVVVPGQHTFCHTGMAGWPYAQAHHCPPVRCPATGHGRMRRHAGGRHTGRHRHAGHLPAVRAPCRPASTGHSTRARPGAPRSRPAGPGRGASHARARYGSHSAARPVPASVRQLPARLRHLRRMRSGRLAARAAVTSGSLPPHGRLCPWRADWRSPAQVTRPAVAPAWPALPPGHPPDAGRRASMPAGGSACPPGPRRPKGVARGARAVAAWESPWVPSGSRPSRDVPRVCLAEPPR